LIDTYALAGRRVADIGSGSGEMLAHFTAAGCTSVGTDPGYPAVHTEGSTTFVPTHDLSTAGWDIMYPHGPGYWAAQREWTDRVAGFARPGIWSARTKGTMFANPIDPGQTRLAAVVDRYR
jgi:hypothetical protein